MASGKQGSRDTVPEVDFRSPPPPYERSFTDNTGYIPDQSQSPCLPPVGYVDKSGDPPPQQYYSGGAYSAVPPGYAPTGMNMNTGPYPVPPQGPYPAGGTPPMGYGMPPGNNTGYPAPTYIYIQPTPLTDPPNDYMGYSIFVTLCCCWIIGLFAIARSAECRSAIRVGDRAEAELRSKQARKYSNLGLWLGIVSIIVTIVIFGLYYGLVITRNFY